MSKKIPVTVLSGFLGSGKTTLLKHLLEQRGERKIAVIVNDMAEINVDANLIKWESLSLQSTQEKLVEMTNGCVCCTLRWDLLVAVEALAKEEKYDAIVIESTGVGEPLPIAQTFHFRDEETGICLEESVRLDTMVTVVDAISFERYFGSMQSLRDIGWEVDDEDSRSIVDLLVEQVEFADVIILNKSSEISEEERKQVRAHLRALNADAQIYDTDYGVIDIQKIIDTGLYSQEKASQHALWMQELENGGHAHHHPETQEYGITSGVYRRQKPFHPDRLLSLAQTEWPGVVRSKGIIWLASRWDLAINWGQAGGSVKCDPAGKFLASFPESILEEYPEVREEYEEMLQLPYGDRRQELVIITLANNLDEIFARLDEALLSDEELEHKEVWQHTPDNWPI